MVVGRAKELETLKECLAADRSRLIVVYGRRRVGKTFLVREAFDYHFTFTHTGIEDGTLSEQLFGFWTSLREQWDDGCCKPGTWMEAFELLKRAIRHSTDERKTIFIDELPWMDSSKSNFLTAFEPFCNDWCLARKNCKLIVCGSATSWILDKLINNKGGLYGRVTMPLYLSPFTLYECKEFFTADGISLDEYDICRAYIAFGGIPFYLDQFQKGLSLAQNIDAILYEENAPLKDEFDRLFTSQFANPEELKRIVVALAGKRIGLTREELTTKYGFSSGGTLSGNLSALEKSKLIRQYTSFGDSVAKYKLIDPFCLFYLKHVKGNTDNPSYWQTNEKAPSIISWMGLAFEDLCWNHVRQIKRALGIDGVITRESPWNIASEKKNEGPRIDLIINRDDRFICLCEMKFSLGLFEVQKAYNQTLMERMNKVQEIIGNKKTVMSVLVTTYGLKRNEYASRFDKVVTMEDLFQK